jgi:hypothetical protein
MSKLNKKEVEETKEPSSFNGVTFDGIDENMELDENEQKELMKFETVQTSAQAAAGSEIEFDKIKISDVSEEQRCLIVWL